MPVKLYSAVSRKTVRFHQLNSDTGHRIAQKRVDSVIEEEVPYEKIVKGFELTKERYVVVTPEELDSIAPEKTRDRHRGLRRPRGHRPDLLRPPVLPRPGQGRGQGLRAAARGDARVRQGRDRRASCCAPRSSSSHPPAAGDVLTMETMIFHDEVVPADDLDDALGQGPQDLDRELQDGPAADRLAVVGLRALEVPRRVPREGARADRGARPTARRSPSSRRTRSRRRCRT